MVGSKLITAVVVIAMLMMSGGSTADTGPKIWENNWDDLCSSGINQSFHSVLNRLSSNITLCISSNVSLYFIVSLGNLENVAIIGYRNPTVNCDGAGGLKFVSCSNVTIKGINWYNCGYANGSIYPGLSFHNSSNITINRSSFQNSIGQATVMSNVSGCVNITNSTFTHNNQYGGHGIALQFFSIKSSKVRLIIDQCDFSFNGAAKSVVYVSGSKSKLSDFFILKNSTFSDNHGTPIYLSHQTLHLSGNVNFQNNIAVNGGGILGRSSNIVFTECNINFYNNSVNSSGGAIVLSKSNMSCENSIANFFGNKARQGGAIYSQQNSDQSYGGNCLLTFAKNQALFGGALLSIRYSSIIFHENSRVLFNSNSAILQGGSMHNENHCNVTFGGNSSVTFFSSISKYGGAIMSTVSSSISFIKSSKVSFKGNRAMESGGCTYVGKNSQILVEENSTVTLKSCNAKNGGAMFIGSYSKLSVDGSSIVEFDSNKASFGGALDCRKESKVLINANSVVVFTENKANFGAALRAINHSVLSFNDNSTVTFQNNRAVSSGGCLFIEYSSTLMLNGASLVQYINNSAEFGGAVLISTNSSALFLGNSTVEFVGNNAERKGGGFYGVLHSNISFGSTSSITFLDNTASYGAAIFCEIHANLALFQNSTATFRSNRALASGGSIYLANHCKFLVQENSLVMFHNNSAINGGAMVCFSYSTISFKGKSKFGSEGNHAVENGGILFGENFCNMSFTDNSTVTILNSSATRGGSFYMAENSKITFERSSKALVNSNDAKLGSFMLASKTSSLMFKGNSQVTFQSNNAENGGVITCLSFSDILFYEKTKVTFNRNYAIQGGGSIFSDQCKLSFDGYSIVTFDTNEAATGGSLYSTENSEILTNRNATLVFTDNSAISGGGAIYCDVQSDIKLGGDVSITFTNNTAQHGGAILVQQSNLIFEQYLFATFSNNTARRNGGAIFLSKSFNITFRDGSNVTFAHNNAAHSGGAIYGQLVEGLYTKISSNSSDIDFYNNTSVLGADFYVHVAATCNEDCLNKSIVGFNVTHNNPPRNLIFYEPATCINNNTAVCKAYYVDGIMLGQDIKLNACVLGFNDRPASGADFLLVEQDGDHSIDGSKFVSIACHYFEGIRIVGNKINSSAKFSMVIKSYSNYEHDISVELKFALTPCHPGFHHDNAVRRCVCYNNSDTVSCSGSTSTIKIGHWFGLVENKSTVSICPNNYCNFTCCEATNGYYQLSPVRTYQCNLHRTGTACGNCEANYTLSFDSTECVSIAKCTTGKTVLVISLSALYWVVVVSLVFLMTYYHVGIGYLYAITYYYSVIDILLNQHLFKSQGLFTTISIVSSIVKVTPQFLGQLCLVKNMTGIDQQFIHYVHPLAITLIVAIICQLARISYRFSAFVSRGIIHVVCYLLLLSYTSVATTSLLLLRSMTFDNINTVFTYLSPDIEYFHGRHLPYFIVAMFLTILIVIGLPLLLLLEPFLISKINFTRIKPLLDQFQGCYRDNCRWFAAYYMICRLTIIVIIIIITPANNTTQILLIVATTVMALIHLLLRPYESDVLNVFDGMILHLIILVPTLSLADSFNANSLLAVTLIVLILPMMTFAVMQLLVYKERILKIITRFRSKPADTSGNSNDEVPMSDISIVVDDSMRRNATVITFSQNKLQIDDRASYQHYRESFMEVMNQVEQ